MELVTASIDRAGDHAAALGLFFLIAIIGGLIWGLVRLVGKSRAGRRGPEA
jgi:flagellar biogenesis protein FliO